jgi:hypothetical protein
MTELRSNALTRSLLVVCAVEGIYVRHSCEQ